MRSSNLYRWLWCSLNHCFSLNFPSQAHHMGIRGHYYSFRGFPDGSSGEESGCQCRRHGFDPWIGKILWRRKCQSTLVFLPGKSRGQRSLAGYSFVIPCDPWDHKRVINDLVTDSNNSFRAIYPWCLSLKMFIQTTKISFKVVLYVTLLSSKDRASLTGSELTS